MAKGKRRHPNSKQATASQLSPSSVRPPRTWQDFERFVCTLMACELRDPHAQLNGRSGQAQSGVDIVAYRNGDRAQLVGVQCKRSAGAVSWTSLLREVRKAETFTPPLREFVIATTSPRDAKIQELVRRLNLPNSPDTPIFRVALWSWDDLVDASSRHAEVLRVLDPTWNPFAEQIGREAIVRLERIEAHLDLASNRASHLDRSTKSGVIIDVERIPDAYYTNLVGRHDELKALDAALADPKRQNRLIYCLWWIGQNRASERMAEPASTARLR